MAPSQDMYKLSAGWKNGHKGCECSIRAHTDSLACQQNGINRAHLSAAQQAARAAESAMAKPGGDASFKSTDGEPCTVPCTATS